MNTAEAYLFYEILTTERGFFKLPVCVVDNEGRATFKDVKI